MGKPLFIAFPSVMQVRGIQSRGMWARIFLQKLFPGFTPIAGTEKALKFVLPVGQVTKNKE